MMATTMAADDDDNEVHGDGVTSNEVDDNGSSGTGYDDNNDGDGRRVTSDR